MDGGMEEKVKSVLGNEEMLAKIAALVQTMSASPAEDARPSPAAPPPADISVPARGYGPAVSDERLALLSALRPFLSERRRSKLDTVSKALAVAGVYRTAKKV